jgi:hypothetical protein
MMETMKDDYFEEDQPLEDAKRDWDSGGVGRRHVGRYEAGSPSGDSPPPPDSPGTIRVASA